MSGAESRRREREQRPLKQPSQTGGRARRNEDGGHGGGSRQPGDGRPGLSTELVLDTALRLAETEGAAALSIRRLAAKLGVGAPTIYWHVGNREALLEGLADRLIAEIDIPDPADTSARERVLAIARALRRELRSRPVIMELLARAGRSDRVFVPARDACLREILAAGLRGDEAVRLMRALLVHVVGFVDVEGSLAAYRPSGSRPGVTQGVAGMPVYPDVAEHMTDMDADELFEFTVRSLLDAALPGRKVTRRH
jgi:AcrR family transcriptional regulator